jgi:hypothetical protein
MTNDPLIERRIRSLASATDDSDWQDVLRRAHGLEQTMLVDAPPRPAQRRAFRRRSLVALALAAAVVVPTAALAGHITGLLGLSNQGKPVATGSLSKDTGLVRALRELGFPSTLQLLGTRDGIDFYAAQRPGGQFCFAVVSSSDGPPRAASDVGCDGAFPSRGDPVSVSWVGGRLAGFAADGVASVEVLDASGATLATAGVRDNLFVGGSAAPTGAVTIRSLDANGNVVSTITSETVDARRG